MKCRGCDVEIHQTFLDLGDSPIANDLLGEMDLSLCEPKYPLKVMVCQECSLVQLPAIAAREDLFRADYVYYSSYSTSWLAHCREYAHQIISSLSLTQNDSNF